MRFTLLPNKIMRGVTSHIWGPQQQQHVEENADTQTASVGLPLEEEESSSSHHGSPPSSLWPEPEPVPTTTSTKGKQAERTSRTLDSVQITSRETLIEATDNSLSGRQTSPWTELLAHSQVKDPETSGSVAEHKGRASATTSSSSSSTAAAAGMTKYKKALASPKSHTVNLLESANGRLSILKHESSQALTTSTVFYPLVRQHNFQAPVPLCSDNADSTHYPISLDENKHDLRDWARYPPILAPELQFPLVPPPPIDESVLANLTDRHISQSCALRQWVGQRGIDRTQLLCSANYQETLGEIRTYDLIGDSLETDRKSREIARLHASKLRQSMNTELCNKDAAISREIEDVYSSMTDTREYEKRASTSRYLTSLLKAKPQPGLCKTKRLLGCDGTRTPTPTIPETKQSYFVGEPLNLVRMSFEEAVEAELEPGTVHKAPADKPRIIHIPDWFESFEALSGIQLGGPTSTARFKNLLNYIYELDHNVAIQKYWRENPEAEGRPDPQWNKRWHEPQPDWPFAHWRRRGGFWRCRTGESASPAELNCRGCHQLAVAESHGPKKVDPAQELDRVMKLIRQASQAVAATDQDLVIARMELLKDDPEDGMWMKNLRRDLNTLGSQYQLPEFRPSPQQPTVQEQQVGVTSADYHLLRGYSDMFPQRH
ncbi:hypothetical protein F4778DRAFT_421905 [Xylariomycetidae sp. FL2044]|nr:hypothetical protein F4778DRAFT_421905 [Xylariomycetidae sp. FL2044]